MVPPQSIECADVVAILNDVCTTLGVPFMEHKRSGPVTCLTFLGIEINTTASRLRLTAEKLHCLQAHLINWGNKRACTRRELESLIGHVNHACKVVRLGRAFLRQMLDLLHRVPMHPLKPHPVHLNRKFRSDLDWWRIFAAAWNSVLSSASPQSGNSGDGLRRITVMGL